MGAVDTYTWFKTDLTNLPAEYGGDAILDNGDSLEVNSIDITTRYVCNELGWLNEGVNQIATYGNDGVDDWAKLPTATYNEISSYLTSTQTASAVTSEPAGFSASSTLAEKMHDPNKIKIVTIGDSISAIQTSNRSNHPICLAINELNGQTLRFKENNQIGNSKDYSVLNIATNGSAYDGVDVYPENWMDAYNQRVKTIPASDKMIFVIALGSNDVTHNSNEAGALVWAKAKIFIAKIRVDFPTAVIILQTLVKRSENSSINIPLSDYNVLALSEGKANGVHVFMDVEGEIPELNITTGDTTNLTYYPDGVHPTTAAYQLEKPIAKTALAEAVALIGTIVPVPLSAPINTAIPTISGTEQVGSVLTSTTGTWTGNPTPTYTYQWQNEGVDIGGATSSTYTAQASDEGDTLTCEVTGTNSEGASTAETAATGAIAAASGYDPSAKANNEFWYDMSDTASIATADATDRVSTLNDKSGNDYHATQTNTTYQPWTNTETENSLNCIDFDAASNQRLNLPTAAIANMGAGSNTVLLVYRTNSTTTDQALLSASQSGNNWHLKADYDGTSAVRYQSGGEETDFVTKDTNVHILVGLRDGTAMRVGIDGASDNNTNGSDITFTGTPTMGRGSAGGSPLDGVICETFGWSDAKSLADINEAANAMATKWGASWTDWT